ncbi:hypothetical protein [Nocardia callitridis]|uniref:hypothetical protein n=1 Tax=Nocardia callitridis TaxID=648753 RepID=UPI0031EF0FED
MRQPPSGAAEFTTVEPVPIERAEPNRSLSTPWRPAERNAQLDGIQGTWPQQWAAAPVPQSPDAPAYSDEDERRPSPWQQSIDLREHIDDPELATGTPQLVCLPGGRVDPSAMDVAVPPYAVGPEIEQGRAPTPLGPAPTPSGSPAQAPPGSPPVPPWGAPQPHYPATGGVRRKPLLVVGIAALVVVGAATATTAALTGHESGDADSGGARPSMVSALATDQPAQPPSTSTAPHGNPKAEAPMVPGYQVVLAPESGAAYDVPAGWAVAPPSTAGGFGEGNRAISGKGYATDGKNYCPGSTRTVAFITGSKNLDSTGAATEVGAQTAKLAYPSTSSTTPSVPAALSSIDGTQHGTFVETKGTVPNARPGCATAYSIYTVAYPNDDGNFVMLIAADTGVPNAVDPQTAKRVFTTIRAHDN